MMKSFAPAASASFTRVSWPRALHITTQAVGSTSRMPLTASIPELLGITMSIVTTSGRWLLNLSTASMPSEASAITSCPFDSTISRIICRMNAASSATRIWAMYSS